MRESLTRLVYGPMPDGSSPDYNRIFDVIDEVFGTKQITDKAAERFMYQYRDAMRIYDTVLDRYERMEKALSPTEPRFMRDPTAWLLVSEANARELPGFNARLAAAEIECDHAKLSVGRRICLLENDTQKLVMTARYICMAEWKHISLVLGHKDRWAKDIHVKAMERINLALHGGVHIPEDTTVIHEINNLILRWKVAERDATIEDEEKIYKISLDDMRMALSFE